MIEISSGTSTSNSVSLFFNNSPIGIEAILMDDGTIVTKEKMLTDENATWKNILIVMGASIICRELCFHLNFLTFLYHFPTVFWAFIFIYGLIITIKKAEQCKYHAAEHMVLNWFEKRERDLAVQSCSRIHSQCGSNLLTAIVEFQILSSILFGCYGIHIPEIVTIILPFIVYKMFPFNLLGIFVQCFTTKEPSNEHLKVAMTALNTLIEKNKIQF